MPVKEKALPDKISLFKDHDDVMQRMIAHTKQEVEQLNQRREMLILENRKLQDDLVRKQSQFEQWKRAEEEKLQQLKNKTHNEEVAKLSKLQSLEETWVRRDEEMKRREAIGVSILEKQTKINNDRIEVEKLRSNASHLSDEANRKMSEAMSMYSNATISESKAKKMLNEANSINDSLVKRENDLKEKEKNVNESLKNLEEIKKIVDPKIQEIKLIEAKNEKKEKELKTLVEEVDHKIYEEKELLKTVEIKQKQLKDREKQLDQKEEEITRKAILNKINV